MSLAYLRRRRSPGPREAAPLRAALFFGAAIILSACSSSADNAESGQLADATGTDGSTGDASASDPGTSDASGGTSTGGASTGTSGDATGGSDSDPGSSPDGDELPAVDGAESCVLDGPTLLGLDLPDGNGMVSPVQTRMAVLDGWGVFGALYIRPWEFLAYYPFDYPAAAPGELAVSAELSAPGGLAEGALELQIGITGPALAASDRPPIDLTLVVDNSGSMKGVSLTVLKAACAALAASLRAGDTVALVTWDADEPVVLATHEVDGPADPALLAVIEGLEATGGSDLHAGLAAGYELAAAAKGPARISRLVLMSDGGAAADAKALELVAAHAADGASEGIYLIGVGVGTYGGYQPALMDSVAVAGRGPTVFVGSADEAQYALGARFLGLMMVAARDVEVDVILPPGVGRRALDEQLYGGPAIEPLGQPLRQNEALVFYERLVSCAPEEVDEGSPISIIVRYRDAETFESQKIIVETTVGELLGKGASELAKGAAIVGYAEALRLWNDAESDVDVYASVAQAALERIAVAEKEHPGDSSLAEIRLVLETLLNGMV